MKKLIKILIVDDHPAIIEGYKSILSVNQNESQDLEIMAAFSCKQAFDLISNSKIPYDIVLLDMILPPYPEQKIESGEDLAMLIRQLWPDSKIMLLTSHTEAYTIYNLLKKTAPDGLLVKSDFSPEEFVLAFHKVLIGEIYYSISVKQIIKEVADDNNKYMDAYNRRIVSLLAKGIKTKNLPTHINLTISAIDKRKAQIKDYFNIPKGNDEDIIREAKKKGFV